MTTQAETTNFFSATKPEAKAERWFHSVIDALQKHLLIILIIEAIALDVLALPARLSFESHLLRDPAETLGLYYLLTHGYFINRDFGYQYGVLNLLVSKLWFAFFPVTNLSIQPVFIGISILLTVGLARFARNLHVGWPGIFFLMVSLPFAIQPENTWFSLEGVFLTNALAEHSRGRRAEALALATASCFVVPSMGYVYGLVLLVLIGTDLLRNGVFTLKRVLQMLLPAATTAAALALLLGVTFGTYAVASTVLPLRGMEAYRKLHLGLFTGAFGSLWYFPGVRIGYYLGTPVAFWLTGTLWLIVSGISAGIAHFARAARSFQGSAASCEMVFTCAALHVAFVMGFYGPPSSWTYYAYILVMGLAAASVWSRVWSEVTIMLTAVGLIGNLGFARSCYRGWRLTSPSAETAYLWAPSDQRREWVSVERLIDDKRATLLVPICGGELLSAKLEPPVGAYLIPGNSIAAEVDRKALQLSQADFVLKPTTLALGASPDQMLKWWPQLQVVMRGFRPMWTGQYFQIYAKASGVDRAE